MRRSSILALSSAAVLVLAACGSNSTDSSSAATGSSSAASADAVLKTADTDLGTVVVDGEGMTVYYFDKDTAASGTSACSGQCLANWPPVTADSDSPEVDGVTGTVGTITRDDGTTQVTLNGLPLYTWVKDRKPGDVTGQGVQGVWWVVAPDGTKITDEGASSSSSAPAPAPGGPVY
ncbi:COG4315 family predicted lipoprotein [Geodermatophilus sp. URMC 64]